VPAKPAETRISGQVFIVTKAGQSIKLGDTPVFLYDEATVEKFGDGVRGFLEAIRKHNETVHATVESLGAQIQNPVQRMAEADNVLKPMEKALAGH
jgi:hypothetical protein